MARTVEVTKKEVIRNAPLRYQITLNMKYKDDAVTLIDKDYSIEYLSGEVPSKYNSWFIAQMQHDIDDYKAAETVYNASALNTAVSTIQAGLAV